MSKNIKCVKVFCSNIYQHFVVYCSSKHASIYSSWRLWLVQQKSWAYQWCMAHGKDKRVKVKSVNLSLIDAIVHVLSKKSPVIFCLDFIISRWSILIYMYKDFCKYNKDDKWKINLSENQLKVFVAVWQGCVRKLFWYYIRSHAPLGSVARVLFIPLLNIPVSLNSNIHFLSSFHE